MVSNVQWAGHFKFTVDGIPVGAFQEVSGLSVDAKPTAIKEGGQNQFVHQMPGRMEWPNLVLKRGMTDDHFLLLWFTLTAGDNVASPHVVPRAIASLQMLASDGVTVVRSWDFADAFPVKWKGPTFSVTSSDVATEELEIAHHGLILATSF